MHIDITHADPEASTQLQVPSEYQDGEYVQFIR